MKSNVDKAVGLLDECLADWSRAATNVYTIMTRITEAKELLRIQVEPSTPNDLREKPDGTYYGHCPLCGRYVEFAQRHCCYCTQLLDWDKAVRLCDND